MKKTVVLDIDGVLAVPDKENAHERCLPVKNAVHGVHELRKRGYRVVLHTSRPEEDRKKTLRWLTRNGFGSVKLVMDKPGGDYYVDDKALKFTSWGSVLKTLRPL